jgi:hypothetical protein
MILGAATDLPLNYCLRYVVSVRNFCPNVTIALVVYHEDVEKLEILQTDFGVVFVPYSRWQEDMRIVFFRFKIYDQFLNHESVRDRYDYLMLTDVRDVVFQSNPFAGLPPTQVVFSTESPEPTLGKCKYNSAAYKACFGEAAMEEVQHERISCAGITMGPWTEMLSYLGIMNDIIRETKHLENSGCHDQAIHNHIVYVVLRASSSLVNHIVMDVDESPVFTVGYINEVSTNAEEQIINRVGKVPAVLHQFDRFPHLGAFFDRQFLLQKPRKQAPSRIFRRVKDLT